MFTLLSVLLLCTVAAVYATQYCATISSAQAAGAKGWVALQIKEGVAQYSFNLDLSGYSATALCPDLTKGLKYHIHNTWTNGTSSSAANSYCGPSNAGAHYDPNFACSNYSAGISTNQCKSLSRTWAQGYRYGCNSTMYSKGHYSVCEVGDTSAKAGVVYLTNNVATLTNFIDYQPPYAANYGRADEDSTQWLSWVFHCAQNANRLVCAKFSTTDLTACQSGFASFVTTSSSSSNDDHVTVTRFNSAVILSTILCTFGGILIGAVLTYFCFGNKGEESSALSKV